MDKLQSVREKIIKAVPEIKKYNVYETCKRQVLFDGGRVIKERGITLEDVLITLGEKYAITGDGMFLERQYGTSTYDCAGFPIWKMGKPLSEQSEELINFLDDLLKVA